MCHTKIQELQNQQSRFRTNLSIAELTDTKSTPEPDDTQHLPLSDNQGEWIMD